MRALITGGGGQLASDLAEQLGASAVALSRTQLDIADAAAVDAALEEHSPDVVFNCAAFHNLDVCEAEPDTSFAVNVRAVGHLARRAPRLVHLSSNYVFDGRRAEPYGEDDVPSPRSWYAITKLAGEHAALAYGRGALVVRGSGLYGEAGSASKGGNFVQRMLGRAQQDGAHLRMVSDQVLQPTYTRDLAAAIIDAVARDAAGVVHLTAEGPVSWFAFTEAILENAGLTDVPLDAVTTTIPEGGVDRPLNGVLARPGADALGLPKLRPWREALDDYMTRAGLAA